MVQNKKNNDNKKRKQNEKPPSEFHMLHSPINYMLCATLVGVRIHLENFTLKFTKGTYVMSDDREPGLT